MRDETDSHASGGSAFSTWDVSDPAKITAVQTETFNFTKPAADPARQTAPHPHEAFLDPTGKFIAVPDLGTDEIRLFAVGGANLTARPLPPVAVAPGSGPRHVAFAVKGDKTFMYLVTELASTIVGYRVTYPAGAIKLEELWTMGAHGKDKPVPKTAFASEIVISVSAPAMARRARALTQPSPTRTSPSSPRATRTT